MKDARVVHENVHCSEGLDSPGASGARAIDRPQVRLNLDASATLAGDRLPRRLQALCVSVDDGDIGSGVGENGRYLRADTA
jgi:hypothetical protein